MQMDDLSPMSNNQLSTQKVKELKRDLNKYTTSLNYEKGVIQCKKILFFTPNDPEIYLILSSLYLKLYDLSSSISCLQKALLLCPQNELIKFKLNNLYFCKGVIRYEQSDQLQCDFDILSEMRMELKPCHYYYFRARAFLMLNKIPDCMNELNKALIIDNSNEHILVFCGKLMIQTGRVKEGEKMLWKAHEINPSNEDVKQFILIMKKRMNEILQKTNENILKRRLKLALLLSTKALAIFPNHPEALLLRSSIYRSMGQLNKSISDLTQAKYYAGKGNMSNLIQNYISNIYNELASQKLTENNIQGAMNYIEESLMNNPNDLIAHLNKGDCFMKVKDIMSAKNEYMRCLSINPNSINAKIRLSQVFYKLAILSYNSKDYDDALEYLNSSISYNQKSDAVYALRARTNLKLNQIKDALEDSQIAFAINPKNQDAIEIKKFLT